MGKGLHILLTSMALAHSAWAVLPAPSTEVFFNVGTSLSRIVEEGNWNPTYRIGDEWGKKPVTQASLEKETASFKRAALATAKLGGGTTFYLGKFNGHHVMATNHHVLPSATSCGGRTAVFPLLNLRFPCSKVFGTWDAIDLTLYAIKVEKPEDERQLDSVKGNFAFRQDVRREQLLLTIGFGIGDNPSRQLVANQDSDCKVFSNNGEYRFMADPDALNPGPYKAWSFANGCDVSHGDSGSAMVDRDTSMVMGIIWTGKIPKDAKVQTSAYLNQMLASASEEVWTELSYAVPALKMGEVLTAHLDTAGIEADTKETLKALLAN